jgi:hypothetical protein
MTKYDDALRDLRSPDTWCRGAAALVVLGHDRALVPLMAAYESRAESDKGCLLDAMQRLGGEKQAAALMAAHDAEQRRIGAHLGELFAADSQLAPLLAAAHDPDSRVSAQALHSLGVQLQTPQWEKTMLTLLDDANADLRAAAIEKLATRYTESALAALRQRLQREPVAALRARLVDAIRINDAHKRR